MRLRCQVPTDDCGGSAYGTITDVSTLGIAQDDAADELLGWDPLAPLLGMMLDQHVSRGTVGGR